MTETPIYKGVSRFSDLPSHLPSLLPSDLPSHLPSESTQEATIASCRDHSLTQVGTVEGVLDGTSTGGVSETPPVLKPLCTKAFQKKTGGWEVISCNE